MVPNSAAFASWENLLRVQINAPPQTPWISNPGVGLSTLCFSKPSWGFGSTLTFDNLCSRVSSKFSPFPTEHCHRSHYSGCLKVGLGWLSTSSHGMDLIFIYFIYFYGKNLCKSRIMVVLGEISHMTQSWILPICIQWGKEGDLRFVKIYKAAIVKWSKRNWELSGRRECFLLGHRDTDEFESFNNNHEICRWWGQG